MSLGALQTAMWAQITWDPMIGNSDQGGPKASQKLEMLSDANTVGLQASGAGPRNSISLPWVYLTTILAAEARPRLGPPGASQREHLGLGLGANASSASPGDARVQTQLRTKPWPVSEHLPIVTQPLVNKHRHFRENLE